MSKAFKEKYLLWFANEHIDFRWSELTAIMKMFRIESKCVLKPEADPFLIVELPSEEAALQIASRSVTLRSIFKLWGYGTNSDDLHANLKSFPSEIMGIYFQPQISFRVQVETFCKTYTMKEKVNKIETFNYLPVKGPVKLNNPDISLHYIEYYGLDPNNVPDQPYHLFFGLWMYDGQRELINKLSLKKRKFIGNTSMDPQLSIIMANQALIKPGDIVMDPFVGTGSLLVAAAYFGAFVMGIDIDYLMLHGKSRPTRIQNRSRPRDKDESIFSNMKQYGKESQYLDVIVGDSSLPLWHPRLELDSILTDPPYGIREATERIGSMKEYKISDQHLQGHIPSKVEYGLQQIYTDLLKFAVKHLKLHGRLVSWIPVSKLEYDEHKLPYHPCLKLVSNSEQILTAHTSRRLLTYEKVSEPNTTKDCPQVPEMFPYRFREHYFGQGETRKQRKARIAQELKDRGIIFNGRKSSER